MKPKLLSLLTFFIGWPLSFVALFFLLRVIMSQGSISLTNLSFSFDLLLYGILAFFGYYLLRAYKWHLLLKAKGYQLPFKETAFFWELSEINRYVPGNIWAAIGRASWFTKKQVGKKDIATLLFAEVLFVVMGSAIVSLASIPYLTNYLFPNDSSMKLLLSLTGGLVALSSIAFLFQQKIYTAIETFIPYFLRSHFPVFQTTRMIQILLINILSFLFFGTGYYFTISSVVMLPIQHFFALLGFFTLSLLLGFLSFITPTGLGVREGIITFGLAKIVTLSQAGLGAIFSRITLIISEILFLALCFVWYRAKSIRTAKIEQFFSKYPYETILALCIITYTFYFANTSFLRYDNFYTGRFDLGNMVQTVWNTTQGRIFEFTNPDGTEAVSRLAFHADFLLILLAPFYLLWPHPKMLLFLQTVVVSLGAVFVFLVAKKILREKPFAFLFAIAYLLNPSVQRANLYDFHAVTLGTTFLLGAMYFLLKKRYLLFLIFSLLAAITKEQVWAIIALFGIYILFFHKKVMLGISVFIVSFGLLYFLIWHAIPNAGMESKHFALSYFSENVESPTELIKMTILSPQETLALFVEKDRIRYLHQLFAPTGYLSLLSPLYLIFAAPDLVINLLSKKPELHQIYYQYTATITPFLFLSAIYGANKLKRYLPTQFHYVIKIFLLFFVSYSAYFHGPLPGAKYPNLDMYTKTLPDRYEIDKILQSLPQEARIASSNNLGSHLAHREDLFTIPLGIDQADFVAFLFTDSFAKPSLDVHREIAASLRVNPSYRMAYGEGDFVLFVKIK